MILDYFKSLYNLSFKYEHFRSLLTKKHRLKGEEVPWFTYPAIEYLNQFDFSNLEVFEYGSGDSTSFWNKRAKQVLSVEHRSIYIEKLREFNVIHATKKKEYVESLNKEFDIIIIDGKNRFECAKRAAEFIKKDSGLIILDNAERYPAICTLLREQTNFIQIDFHGMGPSKSESWTTSLFLARNIDLKPLNNQPAKPINGIRPARYTKAL
jgi:hypothetical protein